jgi:hypothetical protein
MSPPRPPGEPSALNRPSDPRLDSLALANNIRAQRAQLKRDLKARRQTLHHLLLEPPAYLATARIFDLLQAVPKYGRVKANKILTGCHVSPRQTVASLTARQRTELASMLHLDLQRRESRPPTAPRSSTPAARPLPATDPGLPPRASSQDH